MAADDATVVDGLWADLEADLAPSDILSANVVLAAQAAKTRMQGSGSDGTACVQVMKIESDSRRFTVRASTATGNYAKFGASWTVEQLAQHREFLAQEAVEQQQQKERRAAARKAAREANAAAKAEAKAARKAACEANAAAKAEAKAARKAAKAADQVSAPSPSP